ncbi:hydroxymethylpyrimidine/phosphomethylpyrimidine kinase [Sphingomonas vulcanisoli]|uniref:hydroxymethylpyrimidine kinase n=1 Tax=Sphingomonas vulcanisoli TaxID=1658060 RepID=A0ABX0TQL1_9SPHN|nr:bifunctional hydroxymethylpyrimidine kinase/phosphomethylpyrimidine kinase [Sphingomonas vulcanisoli]NIJ07816.1 hydroxymethylpyrimidine/phosphomethylpyrimidine kinase [Sphingomonas vulcanisoli]
MTVPRILSIAGSDSGGGAGIQADIKTITALGGHAMTAITAITAQNTVGVADILVAPVEMVIAQIDAVVGDIGVDAIKIGMIGSAEIAEAVADRLSEPDLADVPVVFDPVMVATSGSILSDPATIEYFVGLLRLATLSTPNLDELRALAGADVRDEADIAEVAARLIGLGSGDLLVTGVRLPGGWVEDERGRMATDGLLFDLLYSGRPEWNGVNWYAERIDTDQDHGTGCTLSSAIATGLGAGLPLIDAITQARDFVRSALLAAPGLGAGHGPMGQGSVHL